MKKHLAWRYPTQWKIFRSDDRLLLICAGIIVGICSGLAAFLLNYFLLSMLHWLQPYRQIWWAFILPALGAAASAVFLEKIVKEGAGHGVPEVIYSVSRYGGLMRFRSSFSRLISSCLTIGSGGSAGPEAPVVMSGGAIGSNIAQFFALNDRQRITLVGCGAAGAIASIFNAPVAALVFAMEVVLGEWSAVHIVPVAIASVSGAEISRLLQGNQIAFSHRQFHIDFVDILASFGLAVLTAAASLLLTRMLRKMGDISHKVELPVWGRAALGGCAVGLLGLFLPVVLGEGYDAIREMIEGAYAPGIAIVAIGCLAKIFATSITLGWGGSGGIFAPCLVIGSFVGVAYHRILALLLPGVPWVNEGCFGLLGMAGLISGLLQAPLTGMFLIFEITGSYEVMLPLIIVSALSTTICHFFEPASFYLRDLVERGQLLRPRTDARVLADLSVQELLEKDCITVRPHMLLREFMHVVKQSRRNYYPVEDEKTGQFLGLIHFDDIRPYIFNTIMYDTVLVDQMMDTRVDTVQLDDDLKDVLKIMDAKGLYSMPVISNRRFVGMISKATILDQYRRELMVQTST